MLTSSTRIPIGKFSLLAFPHVSCAHRAAGLLCPFILPFLSSLSTHERFTSRVKDTRPPVLYRDQSSGHDTALHMEFLDCCASILIHRGLGILMIFWYYCKKHLGKENWPILRKTRDKLKYLYVIDIPSRRSMFAFISVLFLKYESYVNGNIVFVTN